MHENNEFYYLGLFLILVMCFTTYIIYAAPRNVRTLESLKFVQLAGLNLPDLQEGKHNYSLQLKNPENYSIEVYSLRYSDPSDFARYTEFGSTLKNGSRIDPAVVLNANITVSVSPCNISNRELYIRYYYLLEEETQI